MDNTNYMQTWKKSCTRIGSPTNILAAITAFIPVLYLCSKFDCWPDTQLVLSAWALTAIAFGAFYIVEPVSYYAALGMSGTYLSFLSGNIGNMRIPCAAQALDATKTEPGTLQAEVVSTLGICGSIITNLVAVALAACVGASVVAMLPKVVSDAFVKYAAGAIFGGTFGNFAIKYPKVAIFGIGIPWALLTFVKPPAYVTIIAAVFGTILIARLFYKMEKA